MGRTAATCLLALATSCAVVDKPLLLLRGVAGGIHNRRRASGIQPFFLPDGRLGMAANGALWLEQEPGGELRQLTPQAWEIADPAPSPDGNRLVFVSGREQITAGGGHNDHVWQVYTLSIGREPDERTGGGRVAAGDWRRLTSSHRAEVLPRFGPSGEEVVLVRRTGYEPYALEESPWSGGAFVVASSDGAERVLTEPLFYPFDGLALEEGGSEVVFGASPEEGVFHLYRMELREGALPELLFEDARLPVLLPEDEELLFVRPVSPESDDVFRAALEPVDSGAAPVALGLRPGRIVALALSPDGRRLVYTVAAPEAGSAGEYRLSEVLLDGPPEPRALVKVPIRSVKRLKPLDVVKPFSWWFRHPNASPGSR